MTERIPFSPLRAGVLVCLLGMLAAWFLLPAHSQAQAETLYIDTTGHYISNEYGFLDYWRSNDGERLLGHPVTELLIENDLVVQYFQRGRLEAHVGVDDAPLMLGHIGAEYARELWLIFEPASMQAAPGAYVFPSTGYSLSEPFLSFWREHDGLQTLGYPISQLRWDFVDNEMIQVQYFERGRLEYYPNELQAADRVRVSALGEALALLRGYDTSPIGPAAERLTRQAQPEAAEGEPTSTEALTDTEQLAAEPAVPQGATPPQQTFYSSSPSAEEADWEVTDSVNTETSKHIFVDITSQRLFAYQGSTLVYDAPVTTGMDGFETPEGEFFIYARNPLQTMSGDLGGEYSVPNVPNSMYIIEDVAMHGTYWHNMFGSGVRRSHGCINLPLDTAAWLYDWAPLGTPVTVTSE